MTKGSSPSITRVQKGLNPIIYIYVRQNSLRKKFFIFFWGGGCGREFSKIQNFDILVFFPFCGKLKQSTLTSRKRSVLNKITSGKTKKGESFDRFKNCTRAQTGTAAPLLIFTAFTLQFFNNFFFSSSFFNIFFIYIIRRDQKDPSVISVIDIEFLIGARFFKIGQSERLSTAALLPFSTFFFYSSFYF